MRPSRCLDPADRVQLERVVVEAEHATSGEIVVFVVGACDAYRSLGWRLGAVLAAATLLALSLAAPALPAPLVLAAQAATVAAAHGLTRFDAVRRTLLREAVLEERASERARRAFAESGLARAEGRRGVLLFVALLERSIVVLADEGVRRAAKGEADWSGVVELALEGLRTGRPAHGLEAAVRRCGEILTRHLPAPARNLSELPAGLVLEEEPS